MRYIIKPYRLDQLLALIESPITTPKSRQRAKDELTRSYTELYRFCGLVKTEIDLISTREDRKTS
jgi:hypothetical protein